jgi:hypothetical protein
MGQLYSSARSNPLQQLSGESGMEIKLDMENVFDRVEHVLGQGQTQGLTLQQHTNKTLTTGPFGNTCEADEVSPELEAGVVAGLQCLHSSWDTDL